MKKRYLSILLSAIMLLSLLPMIFTGASAADADNLFNVWETYCGVITKEGKESYDIRYQTTGNIAVKSGDTVVFGPVPSDQTLYLSLFDGSGKMTKQTVKFSELTDLGTVVGDCHLCSFRILPGTASVRITLAAACWNVFTVYLNKTTTVEAYRQKIAADGLGAYLDYLGADKSVLGSKSLLWCGDSVGAGSYEKNYPGAPKSLNKNNLAWAGRIANIFGIPQSKVLNTSAGGACLAIGKHSATVIPEQVTNNGSKYDIIVIEGGNVDMAGYKKIIIPTGYISDSYDPATFAGEDTLLGALELSFYNAIKENPHAYIFCVVPYRAVANMNCQNSVDRGYKYYKYVCEKWGIPYVDLSTNDVTNAAIDKYPGASDLFFYDNLHCTPLGYTITANEIAMKMLSMHPYSEADRHMPDKIPDYVTEEGAKAPPSGNFKTYIDVPENVYDPKKVNAGYPDSTGKNMTETGTYLTTDYIAVKPGDVVYVGPCSPYDECTVFGYSTKKAPVTGQINAFSLTAVDYFSSGRVLYSYTVPANVGFVRISSDTSSAPFITVNVPFTRAYYNYALGEALSGRTPGSIADFEAGKIDVPPVENVSDTASGITSDGTSAPDETGGNSGENTADTADTAPEEGGKGCKSSLMSLSVTAAAALIYTLRKTYKKEE